MQCNDARTLFSQIAEKSITMQIPRTDMDFLFTNGYVTVMQKGEYDQASAEVSNLEKMRADLQTEKDEELQEASNLYQEEKKTHSILFHFEAKEKKEAELEKAETEKSVVSKEEADITEKDSKLTELIQKRTMIDRMVPYDGKYIALSALGVTTLNDLNIRNYRLSDTEFTAFIEESKETSSELQAIAERASVYVATLRTRFFFDTDLSQLWSVGIGLGKLQGDQNQISQRFLQAMDIVEHFSSTMENKMLAAEIMTSTRPNPNQSTNNSDLQDLSQTLKTIDRKIRHDAKVPKQLSAGVAAIILFGRRFDGTFPTDRFVTFSKTTASCESAAILSVTNVPTDQLTAKFLSFRALFGNWGFDMSEDTELASAYLSISELGPDDVRTKMAIIVDALRNYLEYPLVATAILTSIPTLEANETLDLMEKAYSTIGTYANELERSELISLSVRMIHGIKNELVEELDPTARIMNTPIQFMYNPSPVFFLYRAPLITVHSSYFATFSGVGGYHPAHVHGVGGFMG